MFIQTNNQLWHQLVESLDQKDQLQCCYKENNVCIIYEICFAEMAAKTKDKANKCFLFSVIKNVACLLVVCVSVELDSGLSMAKDLWLL